MTLSHPPSVPRTCPQDVVRIGHRWQDAEVSTGTPTTLAVEPDPRCSSGVITLAQPSAVLRSAHVHGLWPGEIVDSFDREPLGMLGIREPIPTLTVKFAA